MSVIGPRPGLWNQDILTAERDKYNANDVKPGLTGWAQINGRDELEIPDKASIFYVLLIIMIEKIKKIYWKHLHEYEKCLLLLFQPDCRGSHLLLHHWKIRSLQSSCGQW